MYRYKKVAGCIYTPCDFVDGLGGVRLDVTGVFRRQSAAVVCGNRSPGTGLCNSDLMCFFSFGVGFPPGTSRLGKEFTIDPETSF